MLILSQINIYPVKSLDGFSPKSAIVEKRGLQYDRRWMITDLDGVFMTQRNTPKMAFLRATIENNFLKISEKQNEENYIQIEIQATEKPVSVVVWQDEMLATTVSEAANAWLTQFLGAPCQLVVMPDTTDRVVEEAYNTGDDIVSFADAYPFLIIGDASVYDLNERMKMSLSSRRFRANFFFSGGKPFEEGNFKEFSIGKAHFMSVKPCSRCVLTTRDPDTGKKGKEPLHTLATYRKVGHKIMFGENVVWLHKKWNEAELPVVKVGDLIVNY
jgi:uncharacterized protein